MEIDDILASVDHAAPPQEIRDLQELTRAWVIERSSPEVLPWPSAVIDRVLERIHKQIELVEDQTGNPDPKTNFRLIVIQTELERFKYLVRSYLQTRLAKIDAFPLYYLNTPEPKSRLSPSELQYLSSHTALLHQHYHACFLSQFPPNLQKMDDKAAGGISMIEGPSPDKAVFARAVMDMQEEVEVPGTNIQLSLARGDVVVVRWSAVKDLVLKGTCELI